MTVENGVRFLMGSVVLLSVAVSHPKCPLYLSESFLFVTAFAGLMLAQSAFTGFCPAATLLRRLGLKGADGGSHPSPTD
jgi:hypothetical protein